MREARQQPHQLKFKLFDLLQSLTQYQMSLIDRAARNPALEDRLRMMATGVLAVATQVHGLINEINRASPYPLTDDEIQQQAERLTRMAMEQMTQWQQETRTSQ